MTVTGGLTAALGTLFVCLLERPSLGNNSRVVCAPHVSTRSDATSTISHTASRAPNGDMIANPLFDVTHETEIGLIILTNSYALVHRAAHSCSQTVMCTDTRHGRMHASSESRQRPIPDVGRGVVVCRVVWWWWWCLASCRGWHLGWDWGVVSCSVVSASLPACHLPACLCLLLACMWGVGQASNRLPAAHHHRLLCPVHAYTLHAGAHHFSIRRTLHMHLFLRNCCNACACASACMCARAHMRVRMCTCACLCACICTHVHGCAHVCTHACAHACMRVCTRTCVRVHVHWCARGIGLPVGLCCACARRKCVRARMCACAGGELQASSA